MMFRIEIEESKNMRPNRSLWVVNLWDATRAGGRPLFSETAVDMPALLRSAIRTMWIVIKGVRGQRKAKHGNYRWD
jgi:hypothetical protein